MTKSQREREVKSENGSSMAHGTHTIRRVRHAQQTGHSSGDSGAPFGAWHHSALGLSLSSAAMPTTVVCFLETIHEKKTV